MFIVDISLYKPVKNDILIIFGNPDASIFDKKFKFPLVTSIFQIISKFNWTLVAVFNSIFNKINKNCIYFFLVSFNDSIFCSKTYFIWKGHTFVFYLRSKEVIDVTELFIDICLRKRNVHLACLNFCNIDKVIDDIKHSGSTFFNYSDKLLLLISS